MENLKRSEIRYRRLFEAAQDGILILDARTGMITDVNPFLIKLLGYSREEFVERELWEVGAFKDIEASREAFEALQENEYIRYDDLPLKARDGHLIPVEFVSNVYLVAGEKVIQCNIRDISRRKRAETETRQRLGELDVLYQSGLAFSLLSDPKAIAEKMINLLDQELDWHHTAIRLYDPESQTLELLAFHLPKLIDGGARSAAEDRFKTLRRLDQGLSGWAVQHDQAVRSNDLQNDPRYFETFAGLKSGLYIPIKITERVIGVISIESERAQAFSDSDEQLVKTLAMQAAIAMDHAQLFEKLRRSNIDLAEAYDATIEGWSQALDLRDKETEGHSQRVTRMTMKLARAFELSDADLVQVRWGALLHDIGKMGVPDGVLLKAGPLTDEEWSAMKRHPSLAYKMLSPIAYLQRALDIPYCHHERWDGSGYPRRLKGGQIPMVARIFAVVDVWDALISARPYRPAWPFSRARKYIRASAGTLFDPQVVEVFMRMQAEL